MSGAATLPVARFGVAVVAAGAFSISFVHIHHVALAAGEGQFAAAAYPITFDGAVAAAAAVVLSTGRVPQRAKAWAWVLLLLGLLTSSAANVLYGQSLVAKVGGALLPLLLGIGVEVVAGMAARRDAVLSEVSGASDTADLIPTPAPVEVRTVPVPVHPNPIGPELPSADPVEVAPQVKVVQVQVYPYPIGPVLPPADLTPAVIADLTDPVEVSGASGASDTEDSTDAADLGESDEVLLQHARRLDRQHRAQYGGRHINRQQLRDELGVSTTRAAELLRIVKAEAA